MLIFYLTKLSYGYVREGVGARRRLHPEAENARVLERVKL